MSIHTSQPPLAVVVGLAINGYGVVRALASHGVPVVAVDTDLHQPFAASRLCQTIACPDLAGPALLEVLDRIARDQPEPPVLFLTRDLTVSYVARHQETLRQAYRLNLPSPETVDLLLNKLKFHAHAEQHGIPMPRTFSMTDRAAACAAAETVRFPVILKPGVKKKPFREGARFRAIKAFSKDEMIRGYESIAQWEPEVVAQEWIVGPDANVHFALLYANAQGERLAVFCGRKLRQWVPEFGTTTLAEPAEGDDMAELSRLVFANLPFRGVGSVEAKRDARDGQLRVTEPTVGRTNLQSSLAVANGINLPYVMYCDLTNREIPEHVLQASPRKVKWMYSAEDCQSALHYFRCGELTLQQYVASVRGPKYFAVWDRTDPMPFVEAMVQPARRVLRRISRAFGRTPHRASTPAGPPR